MTLIGAILRKVQSQDTISKKYTSPPPELEHTIIPKKKRKINKLYQVPAKVDSSSPAYAPGAYRALLAARARFNELYSENMRLVLAIKKAHNMGRVDDRWEIIPSGSKQYYDRRVSFFKKTRIENQQIFKRIMSTGPRVVPTACLRRDWSFNRSEMIRRAQAAFVLFPLLVTQHVEDAAFLAPPGVKRPRVHLTLRIRGCAVLGNLMVELFTDVCPRTCGLFLELLDGDGLGYGYVGTKFFRKVPGLFWSGGDVVYDNGFGCYAQRGRSRPIGAESCHFSHSMPGLLSMRLTKDDEMCGIFNITFKPLPQFDLRNEVFGRVIRPCDTYECIRSMGSPLGAHPIVELTAARRRQDALWTHGVPNTRIAKK